MNAPHCVQTTASDKKRNVQASLHPTSAEGRTLRRLLCELPRLTEQLTNTSGTVSGDSELQAWSDSRIAVLTDHPSREAADRVFPVFGDENARLIPIISSLNAKRILDIGTGSGLLAIAAAKGQAEVYATDVNPRALRFAAFNARINDVEQQIQFWLGDLLPPSCKIRFDLILCNPPFTPNPNLPGFHLAGDGGWDGSAIADRVFGIVPRILADDGVLLMNVMSLQRHGTPYVLGLAARALPPDLALQVWPVYDTALPLQDYLSLFRRSPGWKQWASDLSRRFDSLAYFVLTASRRPIELPTPAAHPLTEFSGNWERRLQRYRCWLRA